MARTYRIVNTKTGDCVEGLMLTSSGVRPNYRSPKISQYLNTRQLDYIVTDLIRYGLSATLDECELETYEYTLVTKGARGLDSYRKSREAKVIINKLKE